MVEQILPLLQQEGNLSPLLLPEPFGSAVPGFLQAQVFALAAPLLSDGKQGDNPPSCSLEGWPGNWRDKQPAFLPSCLLNKHIWLS